VAEIRS
jgi:hypothetical protein